MTRSTAPTDLEEQALLERARSFAREENIKIQTVLKTAGITSVVSPSVTAQTSTIIPSLLPNLAIFNRIYIGSIFFELTDSEIASVFSVFGPVKSVMMVLDPTTKRHRGYGFIEFDTPDAASMAQLTMDNAELGGRHIKVGRPNNFPSDLPPGVPRPLPNRIYVSNIHELIQEDEIKAIFEAFGPLRHCNLCPDIKLNNQHRGFGYVEYEVVADAINAMNSLNNFELAGRQLKIGKTVVGGPIPLGMKDAIALKLEASSDSDVLNLSQGSEVQALNQVKLPSAVLRAAQQINAALGTTSTSSDSRWGQGPLKETNSKAESDVVVVMSNLIEPEELQDPTEAKELVEDITTECEKFGTLADPITVHTSSSAGSVLVFVKYTNPSDCSLSIQRMNGRWFAGRQISAKLFPLNRYESQDFD